MEKYITSNRFIERPEFILSREKYDGTKTYPYKDIGYYMWIYNEIETARDKSLFIFNFLREQYHAGIGSMEWIPDTEDQEQKLTSKDITKISKELEHKEHQNIATAELITEEQLNEIVEILEREE
jgi:arginyl-tRNA synthetase